MAGMTAIGRQRVDSILAALKRQAMTLSQLAAALNLGESNAWMYVRKLRKAEPRRVYISGYKTNTGFGAGRPAPIFSAGNRPDVEFVPNNRPTRKTSAAERRDKVMELLTEKPRTSRELGECMHVVRATALIYVTQLRRENKIYVKRWKHPSTVNEEAIGGAWSPVYAVGNKPDKPQPVAETSAQRHARRKLDPAYVADARKRRKQQYMREKVLKKPQGIFAALGL